MEVGTDNTLYKSDDILQIPEVATGPRRISQEAATEDHEAQIGMSPRENTSTPSPDDPRSSSEDLDKASGNAPVVTFHKSSYVFLTVCSFTPVYR